MSGAILSSIIEWMIGNIPASLGLALSSQQASVHEDLSKMERTLLRIQAVLSDAEEREIRDEAVKLWLKELKDLAYLAEDVLAEFGYEFLRIKAKGADLPQPATRKRKLEARKLDATAVLPTQIAIPGGMQSRIKDISIRFDELAEERKALSLTENIGVRRSRAPVQPPQSTPYVDESCVYGREEDKKKIVEMLVSEKASAYKLSVIPIIGMAGIGKTTLARLVYEDPTVRQCFNTRVWVSVSVDFDVIKIYNAIIESITQEKCDLTELSSLQSVLKEELVGKRLLLVLDDVWTEDISLWDSLRVAFINGGRCKVLVTTRKECSVKKDEKVSYIANEANHLSLIPYEAKADIQFEPLKDEYRRIRSLLYVNTEAKTLNGGGLGGVCQNVRLCSDLFRKLPCLRVIDLSYTRIKELPNSIGQLKLLCYLGLRGSTIKRLPNSLGSLYYLQTLDLKYCTSLQELPNGIVNLINLRHLELPTKDFAACVSLPSGIGTLTRLETLPAFNVNRCCRIDELKQLRNLRGHLGIAGLQNVASGKEASIADLKAKEHLQTLALIWNSEKSTQASSSQGPSEQHSDGSTLNTGSITETSRFLADGIIQNLQPYRNLRHLILRGYCGMRFPSWLGDPSFSRLNSISLTKCHSCKLLPPLGQLPCLQDLLIGNMDGIQHVGCEFCGHSSTSSSIAFRALDTLDLECLNQWGEWTGVKDGDFPCLRSLVIKHCSKLNGLPLLPTSLEILEMENVEAITALPKLPSVKSLDLQGKWNENLWASTLELQSLHSLEISWSEDLSILDLHGSLNALNNLDISDCINLTSIVELHKITSLEHLRLHALPKFQFSPDDRLPPTLLSLDITSCPNLTSLPLYQPLSALRELSITNCEQLSTLMCLQNLNSLESLTLDLCPELFLNSDDVLPFTLQYLKISSCNKLSALPRLHENLSALKELHIEDCEQLTTVVGLCNLTSLELMVISFCPKFHFLPDEQLPNSTLDIEIEDCPRLTEWCQRHGIKQKNNDWEDLDFDDKWERHSKSQEYESEEN
ncbi:disease resistance RPP13-like protein 1 [Musa troglodytarum]|uniref:Disease resistance RPP13-like protein 1 n=1 Tax=Musa troglodytarum TaxID=320322 RepID=A0A9E7G765_9LILI|nr:disease resistance RPP13-like protein 1 [Musa troglodytarum]